MSAVATGAVALVLVGIVIRGAVLPEAFASERSLLFRWHYLVSSASIVADAPGLGVGPDGYQAAYVKHRVPRNPEEVTSAHSVFVDWVADLGVAGVAWIALALLLAWRAGARLARERSDDAAPTDTQPREMFIPALVLAAIAVAPAIAVEAHALAAGRRTGASGRPGCIRRGGTVARAHRRHGEWRGRAGRPRRRRAGGPVARADRDDAHAARRRRLGDVRARARRWRQARRARRGEDRVRRGGARARCGGVGHGHRRGAGGPAATAHDGCINRARGPRSTPKAPHTRCGDAGTPRTFCSPPTTRFPRRRPRVWRRRISSCARPGSNRVSWPTR